MPKEYSTKFKTEVIKRYQNGESILALSQELRIAQSTIYHWRKEFCSIKAANRIYTPKEFDALSRRLEKLEHEMEIIKRSGYIADVPLQKKLSVLENIYRQADNTYSVHELCEALDIARRTFYNYIFRRADHSKREEAQIELMRLVQQVFDDSSQRFGAEKIRVTLAGSGVRVSTKRIAAIMQELGLQSIRPDAKKQYKKQQQYKKQNLLERQFTADHPNQIWVSDITYFKVNDYWMYLCIILDLFSRRIVDYRVSRNASTNLVTSTFRTAFRERGNPREALIKSVAVDGERFFVKTRFEKRRNTVCISRFSNRRIGGKDPSSAVGDLFRGSLMYRNKSECVRMGRTAAVGCRILFLCLWRNCTGSTGAAWLDGVDSPPVCVR